MKRFLRDFTKYLILLNLIFIVFCNTACNKDLKWDSSIEKGKFSNGMTYYLKNNKKPENRIILKLVVHVGSTMEEDDQKGIAHFIEHLAFNGTTNFEKSAIVDYFEKIGMKFGPEVNAYTSFEETVYELEVPADDIEMLRTSLLVLHDWASEISFDPEEIEKERGVIVEEWRLRSAGVQGRYTEAQINMFLKDSRYVDRIPIGDMNIIKTIQKDRIVDFYKKYYRPENMSVVAVGDIDTNVLKQEIESIMGKIPESDGKEKVQTFNVPKQEEKTICIFQDPEIPYTTINLFKREPDLKPILTEEDLYEDYLLDIINTLFKVRLNDLASTEDAICLYADSGNSAITKNAVFSYLGIIPKEGKFDECLELLLDELEKFYRFGVTESELKTVKTKYLSDSAQNLKNKDLIDSNNYANVIVNSDLYKDSIITYDERDRLVNELISKTTLESINEKIKKQYADRGDYIFIMAPDYVEIESNETIMDIWENYENPDITEYEEDIIYDQLVKEPLKKPKIISEKQIPELDAKEYVLENGVTIVAKKTDTEKNLIKMKALSFGGSNYVSDKDYPSSKIAFAYAFYSGFNDFSYNQIIKTIRSKQIELTGKINTMSERFFGTTTNEDFSYLVQLINLFFTSVNFNDTGWSIVYEDYLESAKSYGRNPFELFNDKAIEILHKDDIRYAPFDVNFFNKIDRETAERIYNERFGDISDFTFYFVGDIDEENFLTECCNYLGSIPTKKSKETKKDRLYQFPKGIYNETVYAGKDEQGALYICFGGNIGKAKDINEIYTDNELIKSFESLLEIRLREVIREDLGGSYGVEINASIDTLDERGYTVEIAFGCEPAREEELKKEVLNTLKKLQTEFVSDEYITKLQESYKRELEVNKKDNNWLLDQFIEMLFYEEVPLNALENEEYIPSLITKEKMKELANKYIDTSNYVCVFLKPER